MFRRFPAVVFASTPVFATAVLTLAAVRPPALSGQTDPPAARAFATTAAPVLDGRLDDPVWADAPPLDGFVQREPAEGRPASQRTEVRVAYDEQALYVAAWLFDEAPDGIVLGQTLRDASLTDADAFVVILDTYRDRQNGFVFGTTPAGIEYDGQVVNEGEGGGGGQRRQQSGSGGGFNLNWDGAWQVATHADADGWYAEMRIPFATLRYGAGGEQTWGINFERRIRRNNEQSVWAPIPRQFNLYRVSLAGSLVLEAPARRRVTVSPYVLSDGLKDYTVADPEADFGAQVGGDAKIGLNQSLTLDLTVNTDFAQAEVDDQQVNLTRFSLFFPEKRAFFLENAGVFAVGTSQSAELFFSRRIGLVNRQEVPIRAGARLTGRLGGLQVGVLNIQTGRTDAPDPVSGEPALLAPPENFSVMRAFKELGNRTRLGGIAVARMNTDDTADRNLTFGLDGRLGVGDALTFDGWFATTHTPDASRLSSDGGPNQGEYGYAARADFTTRDWAVSAGFSEIGDAFNPEAGFLNRRDYRQVNARVLRHLRTPGTSWFREFRPHVSWNQYWSLDGFMESYLVHIDSHFAFENGAFFQLPGLNLTGEGLAEPFEIREGIVIPAGTYHNAEWSFRANTNQSAPLSASGGWTLGGFYSGTQFAPNLTVDYRWSDTFATSLRFNYFDVNLDEGDFTTAVIGWTGSYSFTPRLYLQANLQYNDDTENVGTNLRLGWLDTAGTGLFIVYNDTEHLGRFRRTGVPAGPLQRQIVIKYTKLFDLAR